jgi:hypothetical protein
MAKIEQAAITKKLPATTLKLIFIASIKFIGVKTKVVLQKWCILSIKTQE